LRFVDPTGYYTEEEIMTACGVTTWDEVLALFREGGALEGLWGWLEILRRANDSDMARFGAFDGMGSGQTSIGALPGNMGFFSRDDGGHIFVGNRTHSEFAAEGRGYIYSLFKESSKGTYTLNYSTRPTEIHFHGRLVSGDSDWQAAWNDAVGITADAVGLFALANIELAPASTVVAGFALGFGIAFDLGAAIEGFLNVFVAYPVTGRFESGHILDMVGLIPGAGLVTDLSSIASNLTGWRYEVTP
jgi:hypothetical protein